MLSRIMDGTGVMFSSNEEHLFSMVSSSLLLIQCIQLVRLNTDLLKHLLTLTLGYAGYYGLSLIVGSYPVLFASIAAHAAQFGFLVAFENPRKRLSYAYL